MFTSKHSIGTLYLALGGKSLTDLADNLTRRKIEAFTVNGGLGVWKGERELSYVVTIIGETASPIHMVERLDTRHGFAYTLMPGNPTAFEDRIRTLAENLALDYGQECVAFTIAPCLFELTTRQATYKRNG